jgi:hypothetical protein
MLDALMQRMDDDAPLEPAGRRVDLIGECIRRGSVPMPGPQPTERRTQAIADQRLALIPMNLRSSGSHGRCSRSFATFVRARRR